MTLRELLEKANKEMTRRYESGVRCMEETKHLQSVRFFRDFSQGEIDGIADFTIDMYLALFYDSENKDIEVEDKIYMDFCKKVQDKATELKNLLSEYSVRFL